MWSSVLLLPIFCTAYPASAGSTEWAIHMQTVQSRDNVERIVGGHQATCEEFPHQVHFTVNNSYFCGGFIVSKNYILTAAHCAQNVNPSSVLLRVGSTFRSNGTIVPIAAVIPHPMYDTPPFDNDVAVMKTAEPIRFNSCTKPVTLPPKKLPLSAGTIINVSGWGRIRQDASIIPERMMAVNLKLVSHSRCRSTYRPLMITANMICAGDFFMGGKGTCQGDSGGVGTINGVAVGIVSFGRGCGLRYSPSVFTNVAAPAVRDFIREHTGI